MLLRKLVAALCPVLLCLLCCILFLWLDGRMPLGSFLPFLLKGLLLGCVLGLLLPVAGIAVKNNGLIPCLFIGAAILAFLLLYQYLETQHVVNWPVLKGLIAINGQVVMVEGSVAGFLFLTGMLNRRK